MLFFPGTFQFAIDSWQNFKKKKTLQDEDIFIIFSDPDDSPNEDLSNILIPPTSQTVKARAPPKHTLSSTTLHSHGGKRARTIFTTEQLERMEREFHKQQYG